MCYCWMLLLGFGHERWLNLKGYECVVVDDDDDDAVGSLCTGQKSLYLRARGHVLNLQMENRTCC